MVMKFPGSNFVRVRWHLKCVMAAATCVVVPVLYGQTPTSVIKEEVRERTANLPFAMPAVEVPQFPDHRVSIEAFGAVGDGRTMNTKAFADAIHACVQKGGGVVVVPPGLWLTGPIKLESNVNLYVERGAIIQFSRQIEDFPLIAGLDGKSKRYIVTPPIYAYRAKNVGISGEGVIDGAGEVWRYVKKEKLTAGQWKELTASGGVVSRNGREWWPSKEALDGEEYLKKLELSGRPATKEDYANVREFIRPDLLQLVQCDGILLDGTTFENSPRFHVRPAQSENVIIRNIKIRSPWYGQNTDGLDPTSCRNVIIYGITVDVGDDGICLKPGSIAHSQKKGPACENIVITDCLVYQAHGGFVIGSESYGGVNNVYVHNCTFVGTDVGLRFKSLRGKGGLVENVFIDGIRMRSIQNAAILFDMYYGGGSPDVEAEKNDDVRKVEPVTDRTPRFQNFSIKNVVCDGARTAMTVKGLAEMQVKDLTLENVSIESERGIFLSQADGINLRNFYIAPKQGPVLELDEARNITVRKLDYPIGVDLFLKVEGEMSQNIQLNGVDLLLAKKGIELGPNVNAGAVIVK
jgi:DNA sulfur modification protein DndE